RVNQGTVAVTKPPRTRITYQQAQFSEGQQPLAPVVPLSIIPFVSQPREGTTTRFLYCCVLWSASLRIADQFLPSRGPSATGFNSQQCGLIRRGKQQRPAVSVSLPACGVDRPVAALMNGQGAPLPSNAAVHLLRRRIRR